MDDSYVKDAFLMPQNLIGVGIGVAAAVLLPFTGPILIGVGIAEAVYLKSISGNPRFQRMVRSRRSR